ncbi:MAG: hypothetical protein DRP00_03120 [Candidatus Aenigmatarchaeota archaeon]|nr:MAG: hypothetical protein DRP00_03120 [Candidatus Aenigmarchaeota archaeon]
MIEQTALVIFTNLIPGVEQVGAIPLGLSLGLDPIFTFSVSLLVNSFLFFPIFFILEMFYWKFLSRIKLVKKYVKKAREKGKPYVEKYGIVGITLLMLLPSPFSGTYTASILSWFLGLDWKKSFLAIFLGSFLGGIFVLLISLGAINLIFSLF